MHWVDRGPEPGRLEQVRDHYTPGWIAHYRQRVGGRPPDKRWRDFHGNLSQVFNSLCGYCEEFDKGEVDHFRPKKLFPELVYQWANWVFACHTCNQLKSEKWPSQGYIDPCDEFLLPPIETCFEFDLVTGRIQAKPDLPVLENSKAQALIDDLRLNAFHHLQRRRALVALLQVVLQESLDLHSPTMDNVRLLRTERTAELSSLARAWFDAQELPSSD